MTPRDPFSDPPDEETSYGVAPRPGHIRPGGARPNAADLGDHTTPAPRPSAARPQKRPSPASTSRPKAGSTSPALSDIDFNWQLPAGLSGNNPLIAASRIIFAVVGRLRAAPRALDAKSLRAQLNQQIKMFDQATQQARIEQDVAYSARYALCSFIDETVLSTPWGAASGWAQNSLLVQWTGDAWGGERFFSIMQRCMDDTRRYLPLIELMYLCLAFGFQGKYRVQRGGGGAQLLEVQDTLYRAIRQQHGDEERDLSSSWRGVQDRRSKLIRYVPLWVVGAVCALIMTALFLAFHLSLGGISGPLAEELGKLGRKPLALAAVPAPIILAPAGPRLRAYLVDEIAQSQVTVDELPDRSIARVASDQCFTSGSAALAPRCVAVLQRVADALNKITGRIEVVGHSDNVPLTSLKFGSNLELSRARAAGVVAELDKNGVAAGRLSTDGRGDSEPLADNATPTGRGQNRRVDIIAYEGVAAAAQTVVPSAVPTPAPTLGR